MSIKQMRASVKSENWQKATKTMFFVVFLWSAGTPLLVELFFGAYKHHRAQLTARSLT